MLLPKLAVATSAFFLVAMAAEVAAADQAHPAPSALPSSVPKIVSSPSPAPSVPAGMPFQVTVGSEQLICEKVTNAGYQIFGLPLRVKAICY